MKVFCKDCKWLYKNSVVWSYMECRHPDNYVVQTNHYEEKKIVYRPPSVINSNNDCKWFTHKMRLFSFFKK